MKVESKPTKEVSPRRLALIIYGLLCDIDESVECREVYGDFEFEAKSFNLNISFNNKILDINNLESKISGTGKRVVQLLKGFSESNKLGLYAKKVKSTAATFWLEMGFELDTEDGAFVCSNFS